MASWRRGGEPLAPLGMSCVQVQAAGNSVVTGGGVAVAVAVGIGVFVGVAVGRAGAAVLGA